MASVAWQPILAPAHSSFLAFLRSAHCFDAKRLFDSSTLQELSGSCFYEGNQRYQTKGLWRNFGEQSTDQLENKDRGKGRNDIRVLAYIGSES